MLSCVQESSIAVMAVSHVISTLFLTFCVIVNIQYCFSAGATTKEAEKRKVLDQGCNISNVFLEFYDTNGKNYDRTVNGCIQSSSFPGIEVSHIEIVSQDIPYLKKNSVSNLPHLKTFLIIESGTEILEAGSFHNLPQIKNISLVGNEIKEIRRGVFNYLSASKVQISTKVLESIEEYAFYGMKNLTYLSIHFSRIKAWNKNWIGKSETLWIIDFHYGELEVLPSDSFEDLPNLKRVSFRKNKLKVLENDLFKGFSKLIYLGLDSNRLNVLNHEIFEDNMLIETLNIEKNRLNYIPDNFWSKVNVSEIFLWGNPWTCECFDAIRKRLKEKNGMIHDNYNCVDFRNPTCIEANQLECVENTFKNITEVFNEKISDKEPCITPVLWF